MSRSRTLLAVALLLGCGPTLSVDDDTSEGSDTGGESGTTAEPSSEDGPPATSTSTTATDEGPLPGDGYEDDDGGTGCTFTCPDPPPPPPPPGGGGGGPTECDPIVQDCPEGEKCMPWNNFGGEGWNATRCSPIIDTPGQLDEPCTVEGNAYSGIDDCDLGLICWGVDPRTNEGTCAAICSEVEPQCENPSDACAIVDFVPLCVQTCDPVSPSPCGPGQGCYIAGTTFYCQDIPDMPAGQGEPCPSPLSCDAGLMCAYAPGLDCGGKLGDGCCTAVCDAGDPGSCPGGPGVVCEPWFAFDPPPQWAHVGVCMPP